MRGDGCWCASSASPASSTSTGRATSSCCAGCGCPPHATSSSSSCAGCDRRPTSSCQHHAGSCSRRAAPPCGGCRSRAHRSPDRARARAPRSCGSSPRPCRGRGRGGRRPTGGPSTGRWPRLAAATSRARRRASPCPSLRGRTRRLAWSAPCPRACRGGLERWCSSWAWPRWSASARPARCPLAAADLSAPTGGLDPLTHRGIAVRDAYPDSHEQHRPQPRRAPCA